MNTRPMSADEEMPGLIDRLVCGELDEAARGRVVQWLEEDPARWRLCGLAFLEAQVWSLALHDWPQADDLRRRPSREPVLGAAAEGTGVPAGAPVRRWVIAAALLLAFGLGMALREFAMAPKPQADRPIAREAAPSEHDHAASGAKSGIRVPLQPVLASLDVHPGNRLGATAPIHIPVVPAGLDLAQEAQHAAEIPEYVRQQWERRGYKVSVERRFLFARLPDGQQVVVPIEQLRVNSTRLPVN